MFQIELSFESLTELNNNDDIFFIPRSANMTRHSYIFTPRRVPYNYQTVPEALEERAKETPDHVILVNRKLDG